MRKVIVLALSIGITSWPVCTVSAELFNFSATYQSFGAPTTSSFRAWLPDDGRRVRGLLYLLPGSGGDFRGYANIRGLQIVAEATGFGLVGSRDVSWGNPSIPGETSAAVQSTLDAAALATGHPELSNVPITILGGSAGGFKASQIAESAPEHVIAWAGSRGGFAPTGILSEAAKRTPGLVIGGELDTIVSPDDLRDNWQSWRQQDAQMTYSLAWQSEHGGGSGQSFDLAFFWLGEAIRLRYPNTIVPSTVPGQRVVLNDIDTSDGWLGETVQFDPNNPGMVLNLHPFVETAPILGGTFTGDPLKASWLPSNAAANVFRAHNSTDLVSRSTDPKQGSLRFTEPIFNWFSFGQNVPGVFQVGDDVTVNVDPRQFDDVNEIAELALFDGDRFLGHMTGAPDWTFTFTADRPGIHALVVVGTDIAGNRATTFQTYVVLHAIPEPTSFATVSMGLLLLVQGFRRFRKQRKAKRSHASASMSCELT